MAGHGRDFFKARHLILFAPLAQIDFSASPPQRLPPGPALKELFQDPGGLGPWGKKGKASPFYPLWGVAGCDHFAAFSRDNGASHPLSIPRYLRGRPARDALAHLLANVLPTQSC